MRGERSVRGAETAKVAVGETFTMLRRYVVQETFGPFKHILRQVLLGIAGALLLGVGTIVLLLALLRVLQTETGTTFAGNWSFAPYLLCALVALGAAGGTTVLALKSGRSGRAKSNSATAGLATAGGRDEGEQA